MRRIKIYTSLLIVATITIICTKKHTYKCEHCNQPCFEQPEIAAWFLDDPPCVHDYCALEWQGYDWRFPIKWPYNIYIQ